MTQYLTPLSWVSALTGIPALVLSLLVAFTDRGAGEFANWPFGLATAGLIAGFVAYFIASGERVSMSGVGKIGVTSAGIAATLLALALFVSNGAAA